MSFESDYTQTTAEELAKDKNKIRNKRNMQFGKDRNRQDNTVADGKHSRPLRTYEDESFTNFNLKRVTKLSDVESE